jgi:hypothetical protein
MNKLIANGNYTLRLHIDKLGAPPDYFWVSFTSELATAKNPTEQHTLFDTLLDRAQLTKLRDLIDLHLLETA